MLTATVLPEHLVELLALVLGDVEGVPLVQVKAEATEASLTVCE